MPGWVATRSATRVVPPLRRHRRRFTVGTGGGRHATRTDTLRIRCRVRASACARDSETTRLQCRTHILRRDDRTALDEHRRRLVIAVRDADPAHARQCPNQLHHLGDARPTGQTLNGVGLGMHVIVPSPRATPCRRRVRCAHRLAWSERPFASFRSCVYMMKTATIEPGVGSIKVVGEADSRARLVVCILLSPSRG